MDASRRRLRLPRSRRLQRTHEFQRTRSKGRRLAKGCLILNWRQREDIAASRLGVITSRAIGGAVSRARARRLLREAFRHLQHSIQPPCDIVLVARRSINELQAPQVRQHVHRALSVAGILSRPA